MLVAFAIVIIFWVLLSSGIIDCTAQLMGTNGHYLDLVYWLPFANMVMWLLPSLIVIQDMAYVLGTLLIFVLNIIHAMFIWMVVKGILRFNTWHTIVVFVAPVVIGFGVVISGIAYGAQVWASLI